ncbi:MAG: hypothetical protein H8E31_07880 [Planctomycetes bacterium]|nr:hypothetical protein [Planctomycetota bacterium]
MPPASTPTPSPAAEPSRAAGLTVTLVLVLLLGYELLDHHDAGAAHDPTAAPFRLIAVFLASAAVALSIAWTALRGHPTLFPVRLQDQRPSRSGSVVHLVQWLLWMRWLACAIATVLVLLTVDVVHMLQRELLSPILVTLLALAAANLSFEEWLKRAPRDARLQVGVQMAVDLAVLTVLIHYSGGVENPLSLLYLFHVIISGILLSRKVCYLVALTSFGLFAGMAAMELYEVTAHYTLEIFPHSSTVEEHGAARTAHAAGGGHQEGDAVHAAHFSPYVYSRIFLQAVILLTTAYFITTIMDRLRAEEAAARRMADQEAEARERLESVVEAAGAGLRLLGMGLRPIWTNPRFTAWSPADAETRQIAAATLEDQETRVTEHASQAGGRTRYLEMTTSAMRDAGGAPHQVVQLLQDVTAKRTAEAEASHAGKLAAVGRMASSIAHEINNPVGILSARLHLLLRKKDFGEVDLREELGKMTALTDRITVITRTLLGHVRSGKRPREKILLSQVFERISILMDAWAKQKGIDLRFTVAPGTPAASGDPGEIDQILLNLVLNAIDASPVDGTVVVQAGAHRDAEGQRWLRLIVEDDGPGVPAASRERIFEPFFTTKPVGKGTGLGLSISRRIVQENGGRIRVVGGAVGARFEIDLPQAPEEGATR